MTSVAGIFAAGDISHGASLVVRAISSSMQTAQDVIMYLNQR